MNQAERIRLARRRAGISQFTLSQITGVQRSAVSHWESPRGKNPSLEHLREIAIHTGINFEWLATGRGPVAMSDQDRDEGIATAHAMLVDDPQEMRMLEAYRRVPSASRISLLELAEQLAKLRAGRRAMPVPAFE